MNGAPDVFLQFEQWQYSTSIGLVNIMYFIKEQEQLPLKKIWCSVDMIVWCWQLFRVADYSIGFDGVRGYKDDIMLGAATVEARGASASFRWSFRSSLRNNNYQSLVGYKVFVMWSGMVIVYVIWDAAHRRHSAHFAEIADTSAGFWLMNRDGVELVLALLALRLLGECCIARW